MKILFSTFSYPPQRNGVALASAREVRFLRELGHTVDLLTGGDPGGDPASDPQAGPEGVVARFVFSGNGSLWRPVRGERQKLSDWLARGSWDLVIVCGWQNWATDLVLDQLDRQHYRGPVLLRSHGISTNSRVGPLWRWLPRYLGWRLYHWRRVPRVLGRISLLAPLGDVEDGDRFLDLRLARRAGIPIAAIPNMAPSFELSPTEPEPGGRVRFASKIFLCVGNFSIMKNERYVLEAYRLSGLHQIPLVLVGPAANAYSAALQQSAGRAGLDRVQVVAAPSEAELRALYQSSLAVLSGSLTECQPLVLLDAMYFGVPFVSTALPGVRSLPGGVTVGSPRQMAGVMKRLLSDEIFCSGLADAGRKAFETRYAQEVVAGQWGALLQQVESGVLGFARE
jgi:1,2-diacylglycerol 3-alpha-glucosyltransferase